MEFSVDANSWKLYKGPDCFFFTSALNTFSGEARTAMKTLLRSRYTWLAALAAVILGASLLLAQVFTADEAAATFDEDLYEEYKSHEVTTLAELAQDFEWQQTLWMPLAPPSTEFWGWTQEASPLPMPFDPANFPEDFVANLVPAYRDGVVVYQVTAWEDENTRDRVFYNAEGKEIGRVSPPQGYDPRWCLYDMYPNMNTRAWSTEYVNWLALLYEPSHLLIRYDLILDEDLIKWILVQSIQAALRAEQGNGGGMMMMDWGGGSVTNIQFVEIQKATNNCVTVKIAYPDGFTNRLDIFTCDGGTGLIDFWWELGVNTNVNASTNWISWTDPESSNSHVTVRFYAAANADVDSDSDGYSDGREHFIYHTNPTNSASKPVSVSGTISYTGSLTGPVRMIAVTSSNSWVGCMATMSSLGAYTNSKVANGTSYWFKAYRDCNSNKVREYGEPWGIYTNVSILVTNNRTGVNITLTEDTDEDDDGLVDWWELQYFGSIWTQDADDDNDGDSLVNSSEYTYGTNPVNADTDNDRLNDYAEIFTYSTSATNSDTDCDNMGDGTEVDNGMSPSMSNTYYSLPFTEGFETNTVQAGSISNQNGWIAWPTNKAVVVTSNVHSGQQALALQESFDVVKAHHLFGTHGLTNVWLDCWMKFNPTNTVRYNETPDLSEAPAWQPCFFAVNDRNQIVAYSGPGTNGTWYTCTNVTVTSGYHRYTVKQDYTEKTWDMYFDGTNVFSALGFRDTSIVEFSRFSPAGKWMKDVWLDTLSISTNQPAGL
jgi:hypothetical protein